MKEQFIKKANKVHNNKYNYSKLEYKNLSYKGIIICPIHGEFEQKLHSHLYQKHGCPKCAIEKRIKLKTKTKNNFINEANKVHNNKYNYSKTEYKNNHTKVIIICPIHGNFKQSPKDHLKGHGCPKCGGTYKLTNEHFIKKVNGIHNDKYDYSKTKYKNLSYKGIIICPIHGEFKQTPENHKDKKAGCPFCINQRSKYEDEIINELKGFKILKNIKIDKIMNNRFLETIKEKNIKLLSDYINSTTKVKIKCNVCNYEWETLPHVLYRSGCPQCNNQIKYTIELLQEKLPHLKIIDNIYKNNKTHITVQCENCNYIWKHRPDKLLQGAKCQNCNSGVKVTHNEYIDKFQFNENLEILGEFINYKTPIKVKCLKCNHIWEMLPSNLNKKCGCPKCFNKISSYEDELYEEFKEYDIERNKRFNNYEIDLFFPEYNLGIEFHGLYWHSSLFKDKQYHKNKYLVCKNLNIDLIQIFENEWINKKEIVLSIIKNKLQLNKNKIYARKTIVKEVSIDEAKKFCELNHIQGYSSSKYKIGLYYNDELVSLITLRKNRFDKNNNSQEIVRFCTKINYNIIGGFEKLLKYIKNNLEIKELISYVDVRYFSGISYQKYNYLYHTDPNYFYFKNNKVLFSRMQFQKSKLKNKLKFFDNNLSEWENMKRNKYLKIYDAGNLKYHLTL
jgi:DNA-binding protein